VAIAIIVFLVAGLFAVMGKGYYTSKKRIEQLQPRKPRTVSSTSDHLEGQMDDLDSTEHGGFDKNTLEFNTDIRETKMHTAAGEGGGSRKEGSSSSSSSSGGGGHNKQFVLNMINRVKSRRDSGGGDAVYASLTTLEDEDDDGEDIL
jgi:hypothetical protein